MGCCQVDDSPILGVNNMEIHKMLVVSTGHLSEACAETLYHDRDSILLSGISDILAKTRNH